MAEHILRTRFYNKSEASAWALQLGIAQGVIDSWYTTAAAEPQKHAWHKNQGGNELYISGEEIMRLAMKALGKSWVYGG